MRHGRVHRRVDLSVTTPKPDPAWLSVSAYARTYGLTRNTVYKLLAHGVLESYRVGTLIRIKHCPPTKITPRPKI